MRGARGKALFREMVESLFREEFPAGFTIAVGNPSALKVFADHSDRGAKDIRKGLQKIGQEMKIVRRNGKEQFEVFAIVERMCQRVRHSGAGRGERNGGIDQEQSGIAFFGDMPKFGSESVGDIDGAPDATIEEPSADVEAWFERKMPAGFEGSAEGSGNVEGVAGFGGGAAHGLSGGNGACGEDVERKGGVGRGIAADNRDMVAFGEGFDADVDAVGD